MQWQGDHYEIVDCEEKEGNPVLILNKSLLNFKKITICDTTIIERNNKPLIWYSKNGDKLDFFNSIGAMGYIPKVKSQLSLYPNILLKNTSIRFPLLIVQPNE